MILWLLSFFKNYDFFNDLYRFFSYSTVRAVFSFSTAFFISLLMGPLFIQWLKEKKYGQKIKYMKSKEALNFKELHGKKEGTPTMGGILIYLATILPIFLFIKPNIRVILIFFVMTSSFILGLIDDLVKMKIKPGWGINSKIKLLSQIIIATIVFLSIFFILSKTKMDNYVIIPFLKNRYIYITSYILYFLWITFVIVGSTNAVNLTDGLDGLAIGISIIVEDGLLILAYIMGRTDWSSYLYLPYIKGSNEIFVFLSALLGSCIGFLWYNCHPAQVFMGDSGALMLGGTFGTIAVLLHIELFFAIFSIIFVVETLSVILQVSSYKFRKKRIFKMAPIHHHFEKSGWHENKIVIRFWIITFLFTILGIGILKLR